MNKQINNTFQVLCLMQVALEKLEDMPEGNIFRENNYDTIDNFIKYLESHVEPLTSEINIQESNQYVYITKNIRKVIDKIRIK
jgi:archaellum component FlaC